MSSTWWGSQVIATNESSNKQVSKITLATQVKFLLFCSRTHKAFANYYRRLQELSKAPEGTKKPEVANQDDRKCEEPETYLWEWRGVPEMWLPARVYARCSTIWMTFVCIKTLFSEQLFQLAHLLTGYPGHCVILGRFVLHPTVSGPSAFGLSAFHIGWRQFQYHKRVNMMSLMVFLLQSERDLEQFYALMRANHRGDYLGTGTGAGDFHQVAQAPNCNDVSAQEQFFRHILCYEVHLADGRVVYKLRANRKRESYTQLAARLRFNMKVTSCIFVSLAVPISIILVILGLSDLRYVQIHSGCSPEVDQKLTSGQIKTLWTYTFTWHRLWAYWIDTPENLFIWLDSGLAVTYVMQQILLVNYDLLLYWRHLNARIEFDLMRVRLHYERRLLCNDRCSRRISQLSDCNDAFDQPYLPIGLRHSLIAREWRCLEEELNELQCELLDFFHQIERLDQFIGDVITTILIVWLVLIGGPSYYYLVRVSGSEFPPALRLIQLLIFVIMTIASHYLLKLHSCCKLSYERICSLMAHDQSTGSTRRKFVQIIEFFTDRKSTTYKLFQRIPYLATTYLKIIGWSFSSMVICNALFGREHHLSSDAAGVTQSSSDSPPATPPSGVPILGGPKYSAFSSSL